MKERASGFHWRKGLWNLTRGKLKLRASRGKARSSRCGCRCSDTIAICEWLVESDKVRIMAQKKILIVDDEKLVRWALAKKCAELGYQSVEAADGEEALRMLQNE